MFVIILWPFHLHKHQALQLMQMPLNNTDDFCIEILDVPAVFYCLQQYLVMQKNCIKERLPIDVFSVPWEDR